MSTGDLRCIIDGFIKVFAFHQIVTAQLLLRFGKRTVSGRSFTVNTRTVVAVEVG